MSINSNRSAAAPARTAAVMSSGTASGLRPVRRTGAALAALAVAATSALLAAPAEATPQRLCGVTSVPEWSTQTFIKTLRPYESVTITPGGRIWAGVWFTGENGPEGWNATASFGEGYPKPGVRAYSLIAALSGQTWSYVGNVTTTYYNDSSTSKSLWARVNDNVAGNGSGAFSVTYCYYA